MFVFNSDQVIVKIFYCVCTSDECGHGSDYNVVG